MQNTFNLEAEIGLFTPGKNVKILPHNGPRMKYPSQQFFFFPMIIIQAYLLSFKQNISNKVKNIKIVLTQLIVFTG